MELHTYRPMADANAWHGQVLKYQFSLIFNHHPGHGSVVNIEMCGDLAQGIAALQVGPANQLISAALLS
jgi:hypothetical protein